jgi:hypothetical protein
MTAIPTMSHPTSTGFIGSEAPTGVFSRANFRLAALLQLRSARAPGIFEFVLMLRKCMEEFGVSLLQICPSKHLGCA